MLLDCEGEYEAEEWQEYIQDFEKAKHAGLHILQLICKPAALRNLEKRVTAYQPNTLLEAVLHEVGKKALQLLRDYPERSFWDTLSLDYAEDEADEDEDEYYNTVQVDKYLSFFWSWEGFAGEQLSEHVNCDTMEALHVEEPRSIQLFDSPQPKATHDFSFVERLLDTLDSFIYVLNHLS